MCSLLSTSILSDKKILYYSNHAKTSQNERQQHQVTILILWRWCELRKYKSWMMIWSLQWLLQFKQLQINPKKVFWTSTGLERMASALALQCYTVRAMKTHTLGAGQLVELILKLWKEWNMKTMWTAETQTLNEDMIVTVVIAIQAIANNPEKIFGTQRPWVKILLKSQRFISALFAIA